MTQEAVGLGHVPHTGASKRGCGWGGARGAGGAGLPNRGLRDRFAHADRGAGAEGCGA